MILFSVLSSAVDHEVTDVLSVDIIPCHVAETVILDCF